MKSSNLRDQLKLDEGLRLDAYPDPLTGGDPWTIGYGHTGPEVHKGLRWTIEQAEQALTNDINSHDEELYKMFPWVHSMDDARAAVIRNMAFNMGLKRLSRFRKFLAAAQRGDWLTAKDEMLDSAWAKQVGKRARLLSHQMETGKWI